MWYRGGTEVVKVWCNCGADVVQPDVVQMWYSVALVQWWCSGALVQGHQLFSVAVVPFLQWYQLFSVAVAVVQWCRCTSCLVLQCCSCSGAVVQVHQLFSVAVLQLQWCRCSGAGAVVQWCRYNGVGAVVQVH